MQEVESWVAQRVVCLDLPYGQSSSNPTDRIPGVVSAWPSSTPAWRWERHTGSLLILGGGDPDKMGRQTLQVAALTYRRLQCDLLLGLEAVGVKTRGLRPPARLIPDPPPSLHIGVR